MTSKQFVAPAIDVHVNTGIPVRNRRFFSRRYKLITQMVGTSRTLLLDSCISLEWNLMQRLARFRYSRKCPTSLFLWMLLLRTVHDSVRWSSKTHERYELATPGATQEAEGVPEVVKSVTWGPPLLRWTPLLIALRHKGNELNIPRTGILKNRLTESTSVFLGYKQVHSKEYISCACYIDQVPSRAGRCTLCRAVGCASPVNVWSCDYCCR